MGNKYYEPNKWFQLSILCRFKKSRTELLFFEAAKRVFPSAKSGIKITSETFSHPWTVDILVITNNMKTAIEFDGLYWHSKREELDIQKSLELLGDGFSVFRLRETGLAPLQIVDSHYFEINVNPLTTKKDAIFESIKEILKAQSVDFIPDVVQLTP